MGREGIEDLLVVGRLRGEFGAKDGNKASAWRWWRTGSASSTPTARSAEGGVNMAKKESVLVGVVALFLVYLVLPTLGSMVGGALDEATSVLLAVAPKVAVVAGLAALIMLCIPFTRHHARGCCSARSCSRSVRRHSRPSWRGWEATARC